MNLAEYRQTMAEFLPGLESEEAAHAAFALRSHGPCERCVVSRCDGRRFNATVVIPTLGRRQFVLERQLPHLARLRALRFAGGSEIIVSHGTAESFTASGGASQIVGGVAVRHVNSTASHARLLTAARFVAAGLARNELIVHLDDDILPDEEMLEQLLCAAADAQSTTGGLVLVAPPTNARVCSQRDGYTIPYEQQHPAVPSRILAESGVVLTKYAVTTATLNSRYLEAIGDAAVGPLLHATNGVEDLVYAIFARDILRARLQTAAPQGWQSTRVGWKEPLHSVDGGLSGRPLHFRYRNSICRCLAASPGAVDLAASRAWIRRATACVASNISRSSLST